MNMKMADFHDAVAVVKEPPIGQGEMPDTVTTTSGMVYSHTAAKHRVTRCVLVLFINHY